MSTPQDFMRSGAHNGFIVERPIYPDGWAIRYYDVGSSTEVGAEYVPPPHASNQMHTRQLHQRSWLVHCDDEHREPILERLDRNNRPRLKRPSVEAVAAPSRPRLVKPEEKSSTTSRPKLKPSAVSSTRPRLRK